MSHAVACARYPVTPLRCALVNAPAVALISDEGATPRSYPVGVPPRGTERLVSAIACPWGGSAPTTEQLEGANAQPPESHDRCRSEDWRRCVSSGREDHSRERPCEQRSENDVGPRSRPVPEPAPDRIQTRHHVQMVDHQVRGRYVGWSARLDRCQ